MSAAIKVAYYLLSESSGVVGIVGDRIYPNVAQQGQSPPFIVMSTIDAPPTPTQDGDSAIDSYRIQLDLFAQDIAAYGSGISVLTTLAAHVRTALARQTGLIDTIRVNGIQSAGQQDDYDTELKLHRKILDFIIRIKP